VRGVVLSVTGDSSSLDPDVLARRVDAWIRERQDWVMQSVGDWMGVVVGVVTGATGAGAGFGSSHGNPECWMDGFSWSQCCDPAVHGFNGNSVCWDFAFTHARCC